MKTATLDLSNLTEDQIKSIAILQHNRESYFILDDKVFSGTIEDALEAYLNSEDLHIDEKSLTIEDAATSTAFYDYCTTEQIEIEPYDENDYNMAYMCLTDSEADDKAAENIKDSLWAFTPSFLSSETGLDEEIFQAIADNGKCEDNNDLIYNTINKLGDMDKFVQAAISADGRGHFMNSYDDEENEETVNGDTYFIYRMN